MIRRLFWFAIGAGVALYAYRKIRASLSKASPEALAHRAVDTAGSLGERAQDFAARVRTGMAEREAEIRETYGIAD